MDVPSMACLPCLKTLQLVRAIYETKDSLQRLLSICPVLEDLSVRFGFDGHREDFTMREVTIIVPSLQSLSLTIPVDWFLDGYEIETPCLKYFKLEEWNIWGHDCEIKNMPNLREAYVDVGLITSFKSVVGAITSIKRLTICSKDNVNVDGVVFNELEHLKICMCNKNSSSLLAHLLKNSPNLRVLDISFMKDHVDDIDEYCKGNGMVCWKQPSPVPECLLSSLQIFKWSQYFGRPQERDIAVYMLKNARHLKTVTILADTMEQYGVTNLMMIKELTLSSRASSTCELVFVEAHHVESEE